MVYGNSGHCCCCAWKWNCDHFYERTTATKMAKRKQQYRLLRHFHELFYTFTGIMQYTVMNAWRYELLTLFASIFMISALKAVILLCLAATWCIRGIPSGIFLWVAIHFKAVAHFWLTVIPLWWSLFKALMRSPNWRT